MNDSQLEAQLGQWLAEGPRAAPARLAGSAASYALAHPRGRSGGWRALMAGAGGLVRPMQIALRPLVLLVLLALTFALGAAFYAAWHNNALLPLPSPTDQPSPAAFACPLGAMPDNPGPADQPRPWAPNAENLRVGPSTFDSRRGQVLVATGSLLWTFDVCGNAWAARSELDPNPAGAGDFSFLVYEAGLDALLTNHGGKLRVFDLAFGASTDIRPPFDLGSQAVMRVATRDLIVRDAAKSRLALYDIASGAWSELDQFGDVPPAGGSAELMGYDASVDRLVIYSANSATPPVEQWTPRTYEYDFATSTWTRTGDAPEMDFPYGIAGGYEMTYDAAHGRVILFEKYGGFSYDIDTHQWDDLRLSPFVSGDLASIWNSVAYDSVNRRVVVVGPNTDAVFAVDALDATWHVLVQPTGR